MIYSALYYPGSLSDPQSLVRDNRFYPGKALDCLPVWMAYVRKHYPDEHIALFADAASPIPWREAVKLLGEPYTYEVSVGDCSEGGGVFPAKVHVKVLTQFTGQYFRPMQRNLVEALCSAHARNEPCFWLDNDAFLNTDIRPLIADVDFAAASIEHHQQTAASVCIYVSAARLRAYPNLPDYLRNMLNNGPTETRMHSLQEGGLYKLFCFGKTRELGPQIDLAHLNCYDHFMAFLRSNPLDNCPAYDNLMRKLATIDMSAGLADVDMTFHDMLYLTKENK